MIKIKLKYLHATQWDPEDDSPSHLLNINWHCNYGWESNYNSNSTIKILKV